MIMNAGSSPIGQAFALKNCDAFFVATVGSRMSLAGNAEKVADEYLTQTEDIRKGYLNALNRFETAFTALCHRNRIERVVVDTSKGMSDVLLDYLAERNRLNLSR